MASKYNLIKDYGFSGNDMVSLNPYAVMALFRYKHPATFSRAAQDSFTQYITTAQELRDEKPFIIINDIAQVSVTTTKNNHVAQMQASLFPSRNYLAEILPGDYVFVWMVQDKATAERLLKNLKQGEPCNNFLDGLKFFGKINAVIKDLTQAPNGTRTAIYNVSASAFTELDASIYYEPYLALNSVGLATDFLRDLGIKLNSVIADNGQGIAINKIIPTLLTAFYGKGAPRNRSVDNSPLNTTAGLDNPNAFVLPSLVGKVFGVTEGTKPNGLIGYIDILEVLHGIQTYDPSNRQEFFDGGENPQFQEAVDVFMPSPWWQDGAQLPRIRSTGKTQLGIFLPQLPNFNGQKTVWSILSQFLNPTVNEIYATLRVNPDGRIFPTLITRQLPFTSSILNSTYIPRDPATGKRTESFGLDISLDDATATPPPSKVLDVTRFLDLPRWLIDPVLMKKIRIGRSDALRFNFIHIQGESGQPNENRTAQIVRDPPVSDLLDIARSGLRPYMASVNCHPNDIVNRSAGQWMYLMSDILMGQHLSLTGILDTYGIVHPICPGDNIEIDGAVFHIETVSHSFGMSGSTKTFVTNLSLTHGMADRDDGESTDFDGFVSTSPADLHLYAGVRESDQMTFGPAILGDSAIEDE